MAKISSTYKDPSTSIVWWIEGDKLAIATEIGDGGTTETSESKLKSPQLGFTLSMQSTGDPLPKNLLNEALDASETDVDVDEGAQFSIGDIIKVDSEMMKVTNIATNTLTVTRAYNGTTAATHDDDSEVYTLNYVENGIIISYYAEPTKMSSISGTLDIDNTLQPLLIDYVKGKALMDAAARENNPAIAQIRMASAQQCLVNYKEGLRKFGMKKNEKTGGTRGIVPANMR
jgi:hypothetical protein